MIVMVIYEVRPLSKASTEQGFYGVRPLGEAPMEHLLLPVLLHAAAVAAATPSLPLLPIPSADTVVSSTSDAHIKSSNGALKNVGSALSG